MEKFKQLADPALVIRAFEEDRATFEEAEKFLSADAKLKRYVLGRNQHSAPLLKLFPIDGVVDDYVEAGSFWNGKPVVRSVDLPPGAVVVNCAMSISPISARNRIELLNKVAVLPYSSLYKAAKGDVPLPDFVREARKDVVEHIEKYKWIFSKLCDDASRETFNRLLAYRLTGDYENMNGFTVRFKEQYFEPFLGDLAESVFIDCGGYDGDTTEEFCSRYKHYKKIFLFEPSEFNLQKARKRLAGIRDIEFVPLGLSDSPGELAFNPDAGSASSVTEEGSCKIGVTTLDAFLNTAVSFIKMDLEGWELNALKGSIRHIREDNPILALSVYHSIDDFWRIPEFVNAIRDDYKIYLRHYTEGWSETVMYFVPD